MAKLFSPNNPQRNKNNQDQLVEMGVNHPQQTREAMLTRTDKQGFGYSPYGQKSYPGPQTDKTAAEKPKSS